MKSSYKLLGVVFDHRETMEEPLEPAVLLAPEFSKVGSSSSLFDLGGALRFVKLSDVLALGGKSELDALSSVLRDARRVAVVQDYVPTARGSVPQQFYLLRLSQALRCLHDALPKTDIFLAKTQFDNSHATAKGSLCDIMKFVDDATQYLRAKEVSFNERGFPLMRREWYHTDKPTSVVTYAERNAKFITEHAKTLICFYCADQKIYPRLRHVLKDLETYRQYLGVTTCDLTLTQDMEVEWQLETLLVNQLFGAVVAVNGVKIVQNLRTGGDETVSCLAETVPRGVMCSSGTLGCDLIDSVLDASYLIKNLQMMPSCVLCYGREDIIMRRQLDLLGIPSRLYRDARTMRKGLCQSANSPR